MSGMQNAPSFLLSIMTDYSPPVRVQGTNQGNSVGDGVQGATAGSLPSICFQLSLLRPSCSRCRCAAVNRTASVTKGVLGFHQQVARTASELSFVGFVC